tara:strand:+ start:302 stop:418 length:117 start_codon:yes stop_codon:yes gene_type:complete
MPQKETPCSNRARKTMEIHKNLTQKILLEKPCHNKEII